MATRRLETPHGTASFDFGAQYFTVRDASFASQVAVWADLGLASRWPDARDDAWIGVPTMNAVLRNLAEQHDVRLGHHIHALARAEGKMTAGFSDAPAAAAYRESLAAAAPGLRRRRARG